MDEATVERARSVARQQGLSLNELIRRYLEQLSGQTTGAETLAAFEEMWRQEPGRSKPGFTFDRGEIYEERVGTGLPAKKGSART